MPNYTVFLKRTQIERFSVTVEASTMESARAEAIRYADDEPNAHVENHSIEQEGETEWFAIEDDEGNDLTEGLEIADMEAAAAAGVTVQQYLCRHEWDQTEGEADESGRPILCTKCGLCGDV